MHEPTFSLDIENFKEVHEVQSQENSFMEGMPTKKVDTRSIQNMKFFALPILSATPLP